MFSSSILRAIGQKRLLTTAKNNPLNIRSSSRNLPLDRRHYHGPLRRPHQAREREVRSVWQRIGETNTQRIASCIGAASFFGWITIIWLVGHITKGPWAAESIRKEKEEELDLKEAKRLGKISRLARET